jgi:ribosome biogenesis GTPase
MSGVRGIVVSGTGGVWQVRTPDGTERDAALAGRLKQESKQHVKLAVGDHVLVEPEERGDNFRIVEIEARGNVLARREPGGRYGERVLAANVDQVLVVFAIVKPEPHLRMIDRFLVVCEANDLEAHLVINKVELAEDEAAAKALDALARPYERAGYPVHRTSVKRGDGLVELRNTLHGKVTAVAGPSGVGKSSLLNALHPGVQLRTGEISESVNKGRHTTVGARLIPLPDGDEGYLVDTPGLREIAMWGVPSESLEQCFPEFRPFLGECRFQDCTHDVEPACAVLGGVKSGAVDPGRHESYLKLLGELQVSERARKDR